MNENANSPRVSIIIRCYNEEKHIGNLFEKVFQQTWLNKEVIIVDSGSTDDTLNIARKYSATIISITPDEFTFGYSLNQGCRVASGEFFVIASAHVLPVNNDWIEQLIKPFENPSVALVYGRQIGNENTKYSEHQIFLKQFPPHSNYNQNIPYCNNANAAIRKQLWKNHNYNEFLSGLEDIEWAKWAQEQKYQIVYNAEATIIHIHEEKPKQIFNRYTREAIALKKIFPDSRMSVSKFLSLFFSNAILDCLRAMKHKMLRKNFSEIVMMRYYQYLGTFQGLRYNSPVTHDIIVQFYYPRKPAILVKNSFQQNEKNKNDKMLNENIQPLKYDKRKIVALLPMKAHSERVKNKNFRSFCGKPLFRWMLDKLLSLDEIDVVVINTDAKEILEEFNTISNERVLIRERRKELCGDFVSMNRIIEDDIANIDADIYVMTHTTNPLLSGATIRNALETFKKEKEIHQIDSLFTVNKFQSRFYKKDCSPINHDPKNLIRTQDIEPWYEENSNLYIFTKEGFISTNARIGSKPITFETPRHESIDIDDMDGWNLAEVIAQAKTNSNAEVTHHK